MPPEDVVTRYAAMEDLQLMKLAREYDGLQNEAQDALRAEFARRNLEPPLVDEKVDFDGRDMVTVARYRELTEAIVARSALESAGVEAFLRDENVIRINWYLSDFIGNIHLQVPGADEAAAREVLDSSPPEVVSQESEAQDEAHCPHCGSADVSAGNSARGWALASIYFFGLPLPVLGRARLCNVCGTRWKDRPMQNAS